MAIAERLCSMIAQWAKGAQTVIPNPPVPGIAYRNEAASQADMESGQSYDKVYDSARYNQRDYLVTGLVQAAEQYGIMPYSSLTNYQASGFCLGLDGILYQAVQPSGPAHGGARATTNTDYWRSRDFASMAPAARKITATSPLTGGGTLTSDLSIGINATAAATGGAVIVRDASGRAQVASPSAAADIARKDTVDAAVAAAIPSGLIALWSGSATVLPTGWALCDGTQGTPDLRDKFVIGASPTKTVHAKGGAASVTTSSTGAHTHTVGNAASAGAHTHTNPTTAGTTLTAAMMPSHRHSSGPNVPNSEDGLLEYAPFGRAAETESGRRATGGSSGRSWAIYTDYTGSGSAHTHTQGATGSSGAHTHTVGNAASAGAHTHTNPTTASSGAHTHAVGNAASAGTHTHTAATMPPWYALAYIMKL